MDVEAIGGSESNFLSTLLPNPSQELLATIEVTFLLKTALRDDLQRSTFFFFKLAASKANLAKHGHYALPLLHVGDCFENLGDLLKEGINGGDCLENFLKRKDFLKNI